MLKKKGYIHLHIGDGKGKTTAAAGMAVRAAGWNRSVLFCQFLKSLETGEIPALESFEQISVFRPEMRHKAFLWDQSRRDLAETGEDIANGWKHVKAIISEKSFDLIVLDEMLDVLECGFLDEKDLIDTIVRLPSDIVLTGRDASDGLMGIADYVTRMTAVKHPYLEGAPSRKGIEY